MKRRTKYKFYFKNIQQKIRKSVNNARLMMTTASEVVAARRVFFFIIIVFPLALCFNAFRIVFFSYAFCNAYFFNAVHFQHRSLRALLLAAEAR